MSSFSESERSNALQSQVTCYSLYFPLNQNNNTLWLVNKFFGLFELFCHVDKFGWEEVWTVTTTTVDKSAKALELPQNRLETVHNLKALTLGTVQCNRNMHNASKELKELTQTNDWSSFNALAKRLRDVSQNKVKHEVTTLCNTLLDSTVNREGLKQPLEAESVLRLSTWKQLQEACDQLEALNSNATP